MLLGKDDGWCCGEALKTLLSSASAEYWLCWWKPHSTFWKLWLVPLAKTECCPCWCTFGFHFYCGQLAISFRLGIFYTNKHPHTSNEAMSNILVIFWFKETVFKCTNWIAQTSRINSNYVGSKMVWYLRLSSLISYHNIDIIVILPCM